MQGQKFSILEETGIRPVLVYYDDDYKVLRWCEPGPVKTIVPGQAISLRTITDIYRGRSRVLALYPHLTPFIVGSCVISITSSKLAQAQAQAEADSSLEVADNVQLLAEKASDALLFLQRMQAIVRAYGGNMEVPKEVPNQGMFTSQEILKNCLARGELLALCHGGIGTRVWFWLERIEGRLLMCWSDPALPLTSPTHPRSHITRSLALESISELVVGLSEPAIAVHFPPNVAPDCCFTVKGLGLTLPLIACSRAQRQQWLAALYHSLKKKGKQLVKADALRPSTARDGEGAEGQPAAAPAPAGEHKAEGKEDAKEAAGSLNLRDGCIATQHSLQGTAAKSASVLLWLYTDAEDQKTYIAWAEGCTGPLEKPDVNQRIWIESVCDGYIGIKVFPPGASVSQPSHCLSLISTNGRALHVELDSTDTVKAWLSAVQAAIPRRQMHLDPTSTLAPEQRQALVEMAQSTESLIPQTISIDPATAAAQLQNQGFELYAFSAEGKDEVVCWVEDSRALGGYALFWGPSSQREMVRSRSLLLKDIDLVYAGQSGVGFPQHEVTKNSPVDQCLSLVSTRSSGHSLHIQARSSKDADAFLVGLKYFSLLNSITNMRFDTAEGTGRPASLARRMELQVLLPVTTSADIVVSADSLVQMTSGQHFVLYTANGASDQVGRSRPVFVFFEISETSGTFYVCAAGTRTKINADSISLDDLTDLFIGKQHAYLKTEAAKDLPNARCLTLSAGTKSWCLSASSVEMTVAWLAAIQALLRAQGKIVQAPTTPLGAAALPQLPESMPSTPVDLARALGLGSVSTRGPAMDAIMLMFEQGKPFQRVWLSTVGELTLFHSERIWLWYAPRSATTGECGTLYWCPIAEKKQKATSSSRAIPLHTLTDLTLGKKTPALMSPIGASIDSSCALALFPTSTGSLVELEAESAELVSALLLAIRKAMGVSAGVVVHDSNAVDDDLSDDLSLIAPEDIPPSLAPEECVKMMAEGRAFTRHASSAAAAAQKIIVYYEAAEGPLGSLCWFSAEEADQKAARAQRAAERTLAMDKVTDLFIGNTTSAFLTGSGVHVPEDVSLSVATADVSLDLETESLDMRQCWVAGLTHILTSSGAMFVSEDTDIPADAEAAAAAGTPAPAAAESSTKHLSFKDARLLAVHGSNSLPLSSLINRLGSSPVSQLATASVVDLMAALVKPQPFTGLALSRSGSVDTRRVTLAYHFEADSKTLGQLLVRADAGASVSLSLDQLRAVIFGRNSETKALRAPVDAARSIPDERCVSLHIGTTVYEFVAESPAFLLGWSLALTHLLVGLGCHVSEFSAPGASEHSRAYAVRRSATEQSSVALLPSLEGHWVATAGQTFTSATVRDATAQNVRLRVDQTSVVVEGAGEYKLVAGSELALQGSDAGLVLTTRPEAVLSIVDHSVFNLAGFIFAAHISIASETLSLAPKPQEDDDKSARILTVAPIAKAQARRLSALEPDRLSAGEVFTAFFLEEDQKQPISRPVQVFYSKPTATAPLGLLYWCEPPPAARETSEHQCIPLHQLLAIVPGKTLEPLRVQEHIDAARCVSFVSRGDMLCLVAPSGRAAQWWGRTVDRMAGGGKLRVMPTPAPAAAEVVPVPAPAAAPAAAAAVEVPSTPVATRQALELAIPATPMNQPFAQVDIPEALLHGAEFNVYTTGDLHQRQFVFFSQSSAASAGSLYWCNTGEKTRSAERRLPLLRIQEVLIGKSKRFAVKSARTDCCLSIGSTQGVSLNLEADTPELARQWLEALRSLLAAHGLRVLLELELPKLVEEKAVPPPQSEEVKHAVAADELNAAPAPAADEAAAAIVAVGAEPAHAPAMGGEGEEEPGAASAAAPAATGDDDSDTEQPVRIVI